VRSCNILSPYTLQHVTYYGMARSGRGGGTNGHAPSYHHLMALCLLLCLWYLLVALNVPALYLCLPLLLLRMNSDLLVLMTWPPEKPGLHGS